MTEFEAPRPEVEQPRASALRNLSVVWLVPVLALAVALGIAWQAYSDRGTLIEIRFQNAAGVAAGETTLRYRDVVIGTVEDVRFSDDLQSVIVEARVDGEVLDFLDEDAVFWVVRPEISSRGVTGLSTVVSGVYIEGAWDSQAGTARRSFEGRADPLFVLPGEEGRRITLRVTTGSQLQAGAPVFYRGIEVGLLEQPELTPDGAALLVDAFIRAPHDQRLTQATRFWDSSGFSISFGTGGLTLDVESLASLVTGGIEFDEVFSGGSPVDEDFVFTVYDSEDDARASGFAIAAIGQVPVSVEFSDFVPGLEVGTRVELSGLPVGEVTAIRVQATQTVIGPKLRLGVDLVLDPGRMGFAIGTDETQVYDFLADAVAAGLRARLGSSGLISSAVEIQLETVPDAAPARFDRTAEPYPILPSVVSTLPDFNATAEGVLQRISALPFERLLNQAITTMASIEELAAGDETQAIPGEARAALAELRGILAALRENGTIDAFTSAVQQADEAMGPFAEASAQLPELMDNLRALSETAAELEIEALVTSANSLLASADTFISSDDMAEVPAALSGALEELRVLVAGLTAADVPGSLNATLSATREATEGLPALVEQTEAVLTRINTLVGAYGDRSDFMSETMDVLREIRSAARSIAQLARAIERNPNSIITGR